MTTIYKTLNSTFEVDPEAKTVTRYHEGDNPRWQDDIPVKYEFFEFRWGDSLYFHAFDPNTGSLRPFSTSPVLEVIEK